MWYCSVLSCAESLIGESYPSPNSNYGLEADERAKSRSVEQSSRRNETVEARLAAMHLSLSPLKLQGSQVESGI
jgi:hypothetical protein